MYWSPGQTRLYACTLYSTEVQTCQFIAPLTHQSFVLSILTDDVSLIRSEVEGWSWDEGETDIDHPERRERIRCLSGVGGRHEL